MFMITCDSEEPMVQYGSDYSFKLVLQFYGHHSMLIKVTDDFKIILNEVW